VLVFTPSSGTLKVYGTKLFVNDVVVDFRAGTVSGMQGSPAPTPTN
jgi:hypothetical protein